MTDTTTAVQRRISAANRPPAPRRIQFVERLQELARSARTQQPAAPPSTLEHPFDARKRPSPPASTLLPRIQSEYREMPGLKLTEAQARRLWDLDHDTCRFVLGTLLERGFLKRTATGMYVLAAD